MPPKKRAKFIRIKRGRGGNGQGACGRGRGGWLGRVTDFQVPLDAVQHEDDDFLQNSLSEGEQSDETTSSSTSVLPIATLPAALTPQKNPQLFIENIVPEEEHSSARNVYALFPKLQRKLLLLLPEHWVSICDGSCVYLLLLSRDSEKTTQRRVSVSYTGSITISVHRKILSEEKTQKLVQSISPVCLQEDTLNEFVTSIVSVVYAVRHYEICIGCDHEEYKELWSSDSHGFIDSNPYGESRYKQTYRSNDCELLILPNKWRCLKCYAVTEFLRRKFQVHSKEVKAYTANCNLTEKEKLQKLRNLQREVKAKKRCIDRLQEKFNQSLQAQTVNIGGD